VHAGHRNFSPHLTHDHHPQASLNRKLPLSTLTDAQSMVDHATLVTAVANLAWGDNGTMSNFTKVDEIRDMLLKLEDANAGTDIDPILDDVTFSDETNFNLLLADLGMKGFHSCKVDLQAMESNKKAQWEEWLEEDGDCSFMELENKLTELVEGSEGTSPASAPTPP